jgi:hypothetical protein
MRVFIYQSLKIKRSIQALNLKLENKNMQIRNFCMLCTQRASSRAARVAEAKRKGIRHPPLRPPVPPPPPPRPPCPPPRGIPSRPAATNSGTTRQALILWPAEPPFGKITQVSRPELILSEGDRATEQNLIPTPFARERAPFCAVLNRVFLHYQCYPSLCKIQFLLYDNCSDFLAKIDFVKWIV